MGSTICPGRLQQILLSKQQSGALWTLNALSAAVGDGGSSPLQVHVGDGEHLRSGIDDYGHVEAARDFGNGLSSERASVSRSGEDVHHGGAFIERGVELGSLLHFDDLDAQHPNRIIVDISRV